jgi:uncharacterized protein
MTTRETPWPQGTPCWIDVVVPDLSAAREFYADLFGWQMQETSEEAGGYTIATLAGRPAAGLMSTEPGSDVPPVWTTYLAVDEVDATTARITEGGGQVFLQPMDVMEEGRMAVVADPTGAVFGLWQAGNHKGSEIVNEPGALTWNECMTRDYDEARKFYAGVFGYEYDDVEGGFKYAVLKLAGNPVGGIGELGADMPADIPPHWMTYFSVADPDDTIRRATEKGAQVRLPAQDTPYGRMAVLQGPQNEVFAVIG